MRTLDDGLLLTDFHARVMRQAYAGRARRKRGEGTTTWPGCKQAWRCHAQSGALVADAVALAGAAPGPVQISAGVCALARRLDAERQEREG